LERIIQGRSEVGASCNITWPPPGEQGLRPAMPLSRAAGVSDVIATTARHFPPQVAGAGASDLPK